MRIFVAIFSVLLLAWVLLASATGDVDGLAERVLGRHAAQRSWWRFVVALFTGELLYAYWRGGGGADDAAGAVDAGAEGARREKAD